MSLEKISSDFSLENNSRLEKSAKESPQEPDGKSIFIKFKENGNGRVDVEGDVEYSEGTKLSDEILKFLNDNKGKLWNADNNKLLKEFMSLLDKFNSKKSADAQKEKLVNAMEQPWDEYELQSEEEIPVKGVDKKQPVYEEEDDEEGSLTLYEPEVTPPPLRNKPEVIPDAKFVKNSMPDDPPSTSGIDKSKPGAKWSETAVINGSGYHSEETATFERLDDMTILKTEVKNMNGSTKAAVLHTRYQADGETLISRDYKTILNGSDIVATAEYDNNGKKVRDIYDLDSFSSMNLKSLALAKELSRTNCSMELLDKDGNTILTVGKDGVALNGKGKPIRKDLCDFLEKYNDAKGLKLIKKYE